jgi:uncharacterized membrane protein
MSTESQHPPCKEPIANAWQSRAMIINYLFLANITFPLTAIVALILSYVWRNEIERSGPDSDYWMLSHFDYHIRTFWIALCACIVGFVLLIVVIGVFVFLAVTIWVIVRCIMSLQRCQYGEEMPDSQTLLW